MMINDFEMILDENLLEKTILVPASVLKVIDRLRPDLNVSVSSDNAVHCSRDVFDLLDN